MLFIMVRGREFHDLITNEKLIKQIKVLYKMGQL